VKTTFETIMAQYPVSGFSKYLSLIANRLLETAVWTFAELGVADLFPEDGTPQTADELAQKQGWNSEYLYRLLRAVADVDIVREIKDNETAQPEKTNHFQLTEDGRLLLSNHPSKIRALLCVELGLLTKRASFHLPLLIREGSSKGSGIAQVIGNISPFEFLAKEENQHRAQKFNDAMTSYSTYSGQPITNAVDFGRFNTITDIGGGSGFLLSYILQKYPTIKHGICFDLPSVIQHSETKNEFAKQNISKDRYEYRGGDMFDPTTIPQTDAYIMKTIIHDWPDDRAIDILKSIRTSANGKQITIFIVDWIILSDNEQNQFFHRCTHAFDLHMMIAANAKERTQKQYEYLFEQSGFTFKHLYRTETPYSVIEATTN
jgi:hypothetical protein